MRRESLFFSIFDFVVVLLQTTYQLSIVGVITLDIIPLPHYITLFLFSLFSYLIRFNKHFVLFKEIGRKPIFKILLLILLFDVVQGIIIAQKGDGIARGIMMTSNYLFAEYLYSMYNESKRFSGKPLEKMLKPYVFYSAYNVIAVLLCLLLIVLGVVSATDNPMEENALTRVNVDEGQSYFFPGYLSISLISTRLLGAFGIPLLTGLSHEPHVLLYLILPAFFVFLGQLKESKVIFRFFVYFVLIILLVVAMSTTSVICFSIVFFIDVLWHIVHGDIRSRVFYFGCIAISLLVLINYGGFFLDLMAEEIINKTTGSATGSLTFTKDMLRYIVIPDRLFGYGNVPPVHGQLLKNYCAGFFTGVLDVLFYISVVTTSIKLVFNNDRRTHYYGLACLYFFLHTLKINYLTFAYPYLSLILILMYVTDKESKVAFYSKNTITNNC